MSNSSGLHVFCKQSGRLRRISHAEQHAHEDRYAQVNRLWTRSLVNKYMGTKGP
jgi:hypothetical protein